MENKDSEKKEQFYNFLMFGTTHPEIPPNTFINLGDGVCRFETLTKEEVIKKYGHLLTEEEKIKQHERRNINS